MKALDVVTAVSLYFAVAAAILMAGYVFPSQTKFITDVPIALSILLLFPLYLWQRKYRERKKQQKEVATKSASQVLFSVFALFALALAVRIPSVLWFSQPYEKTPLIYLLVLTILAMEETDLSTFGFRTDNMGKSLLQGVALFALLGGAAAAIYYGVIYGIIGEMPIQGFYLAQCLLQIPFMTLCVGISEEGLFRGYMQTHLEKIYGGGKAILFQAVLFGFWHFVWDLTPFSLVGMTYYISQTFFFGLLFGYVYSKTRNLVPVVLAHGLWNSILPAIEETQKAQTASAPWLLPMIVTCAITILGVYFLTKRADSENTTVNS